MHLLFRGGLSMLDATLEKIRFKYLRRQARLDADDDIDWITTETGTHIPIENEVAVGGPLKGRSFEDAKTTPKAKASKEKEFDPFEVLMGMAKEAETPEGQKKLAEEEKRKAEERRKAEQEKQQKEKERAERRAKAVSKLPQATLSKVAEKESEILKSPNENLVIFNSNGDALSDVTGSNGDVTLTPGLLHKMENRVVTHNHPQEHGGTFSENDISAFCGSGAKAFRAVAKEGVYHLERGSATHQQVFQFGKEARKAAREMMQEQAANVKQIDNAVKDGEISKQRGEALKREIHKELTKELNTKYEDIADKYGIIYFFKPA